VRRVQLQGTLERKGFATAKKDLGHGGKGKKRMDTDRGPCQKPESLEKVKAPREGVSQQGGSMNRD